MALPDSIKPDELTNLVNGTPPSKGHKKLLAALNQRFPDVTFKLGAVRDGIYDTGGIVTTEGERVADNLEDWLKQAYEEAGRIPRKVWEAYKNRGWIATEIKKERIYLAAQYGPRPEEFIQIELYSAAEVTESELFDQRPFSMPSSFRDLFEGWKVGPDLRGNRVEQKPVGEARYEFHQVNDVAEFVQQAQALETQERIARLPEVQRKKITIIETGPGAGPQREEPLLEHMPNFLGYKKGLTRLMEDWAESSAGRSGQVFSDHWSLQLSDYEHEGHRYMDAVPVWVTTKRIAEIQFKSSREIYALIDKVEKFDAKVGCPFAWFFWMLHGNRLSYPVGKAIYQAAKHGDFRMPPHDFAILERWHDNTYSF